MALSNADEYATFKYKQMLGLTNFNYTKNTTIMVASTTIYGGLYISTNSIFNESITILASLNVSNNSLFNNVSVLSNLNSNNGLFLNNASINSNLDSNNINTNNININNYAICNNVNCNNNLNVSNTTFLNNNLYTNLINALNNNINIYANNILLGNVNTNININGTTSYIAVNQTRLLDKLIAINGISSNTPIDNGSYSGIEIKSTSGLGFIRLNQNCNRFEIKAPLDNTIRYISTLDENNNLIVSGNTLLYGTSTIKSILNVNGQSLLQGNIQFDASVITSGNTLLRNSTTILSNIVISGNTIFNNNTSILSSLYVNGQAKIQGTTTFASKLNINGNTSILGSISLSSDLNIYGSSMLAGQTTLNSNLYISGITSISGAITLNSSLYIKKDNIIYGSYAIKNNLNVSNITILQGLSTLNSNFNVNGNTIINGKMTIGSIVQNNNLNVLSKMILKLPEYKTNTEAVSNGTPLWGFYRTGGILKIRLDDTPPILYLTGSSLINIYNNSNYYEPGILAIDNVDKIITPYLISLSNSHVNNIINNPIPITGPNILITSTSLLPLGLYNITYSATDTTGNISTPLYRSLNIISNIIIQYYNTNNIYQGNTTYTIYNNNLINNINSVWCINPLLLTLIDFNKSWSVIVQARSLYWGDNLEFNIDPNITTWNTNNGHDSGISNIYFKDSLYYFNNDSTYWTSSIAPVNFYPEFNNTNGIYIKISRSEITNLITISFYDNNETLIDSKDSNIPIYYINKYSFISFTSFVNINWLNGFLIHTNDTNANISEFKTFFI